MAAAQQPMPFFFWPPPANKQLSLDAASCRVHYRLKADVVKEQCRRWASEAKARGRSGQGQQAAGEMWAMSWPGLQAGATTGSVEHAAANVVAALNRLLANGER